MKQFAFFWSSLGKLIRKFNLKNYQPFLIVNILPVKFVVTLIGKERGGKGRGQKAV